MRSIVKWLGVQDLMGNLNGPLHLCPIWDELHLNEVLSYVTETEGIRVMACSRERERERKKRLSVEVMHGESFLQVLCRTGWCHTAWIQDKSTRINTWASGDDVQETGITHDSTWRRPYFHGMMTAFSHNVGEHHYCRGSIQPTMHSLMTHE